VRLILVFALGAAFGSGASPSASLEDAYHDMYNLQFDEAHQAIHEWEQGHPANPLGPAADAAADLFAEFERLHILQSEFFAEDSNFLNQHQLTPDPRRKQDFDQALEQAKKQAASAPAGDADALFAQVLVFGLNSDYLALIEKRNLAALGETKQAHAAADKLLMLHPDYYDAYVAVGLENYLLSLRSAPVRWLLRMGGSQTDKSEGIQKLRVVAEKGHYLMPFARLLLAVAAVRDKDRASAKRELGWLAEQFPANHLFREEFAKVQ
jgi:tetratricopeptide (TPR) repeat protein